MNYYVTIVNKDSHRCEESDETHDAGEKTIAAVNYKDALMDAIYEAGIPASQERVFDRVMMTIEASAGIPA